MANKIMTTHVGSLPRPTNVVAINHQRFAGEKVDEGTYQRQLRDAVADVVRRQKEAGIDLVNDGEFGHSMAFDYDFGAWLSYVIGRMAGVEAVPVALRGQSSPTPPVTASADDFVLGAFNDRRDWSRFREAYTDPRAGCALPEQFLSHYYPVVRGPISYKGHDALQRDIANLKAGLAAAGIKDGGWMNSVAPASCARFTNEFYKTDEELLYACADAMREEYKAIIDAGLVIQLDDPVIATNWDQSKREPSVEAYKRYLRIRIEALNHAIRGLPPERIRFHLCWGSWHGPHSTDLPMAHLVDIMLAVNAGAYSFEAANVRHEHEWRLWKDVKLPAGKVIMPGVVTHSTNVLEHPEVVADRIVRFARSVGRDSIIASTDCGLGGRVHPQIAWAKLEALAQGADLATKRLWS